MHKNFFVLAMLFCSIYGQEDAINLNVDSMYTMPIDVMDQDDAKVSLVIPCHPLHADHLYLLLGDLENQTVLPDEVIISLSRYKEVLPEIMAVLEESWWMFPVTIILSEERLYAGQNRNIASDHAKGEVIAYQDADDIAHPQRIAIIKLLFTKYKLDHLMHRFTKIGPQADMPIQYQSNVVYLRPSSYEYQVPGKDITNGNIAVSKNLFNSHRWPEGGPVGEDETYNRMLYTIYDRRVIVHNSLLRYRQYLSACCKHRISKDQKSKKLYQTKIIYRDASE